MPTNISAPARRALCLLLAVAAAFMLVGCGKPQSDEAAPPASSMASSRATFSANPNPVAATDPGRLGETNLNWSTTATQFAEIHVGKPDGPLFCKGASTGSCTTGHWVTNGMTFYLQDSTAATPTDAAATLATVAVTVK